MKFEKQDINFMKLFTLYEIVELVICFIFNHCIYLAYWRLENGEIVNLAYTIKNFMYGLGLAIQYGLVFFIWIVCVLWDIKYLKIVMIALYCSIDMIIPLVIPMFFFIVWPYVSGFAHLVYWLLGFAVLVIYSKVAFFRFYQKRFCSHEERPKKE